MRQLTEITVAGFRVFCESQTVPLDSNVVLIHGPNGCGKTSLLHAIELCLTGTVADLDVFPDSYPQCLRHCDAGEDAWVSLSFVDDSGKARDGKVVLPKGGRPHPTAGLLSRPELRHFQERCYLSQSRLARLLEIYQAVDKERKESPLATFVRELLGLDVLENLTSGLQISGDIRRIRRDIKAFTAFEQERQDLSQAEEQLQSQLRDALQILAESTKAIGSDGSGKGQVSGFKSSALTDAELSTEIIAIRTELSAIEQSEAVLASLEPAQPVIPQSDLDSEIRERERIQEELAVVLRDHVNEVDAFLGISSVELVAIDDAVQFGEEWEQKQALVQGRIKQVRADIDSYIQWNAKAIAARTRSEELDKEWLSLSKQIAAEQTPTRAFAETLGLILDHVKGNRCPVCDRDFSEVGSGELQEHIRQKLADLERKHSLLATLLDLQAKRDDQRSQLAETESKDADVRSKWQEAEKLLARGLLLERKHEELSQTRNTWSSNDHKQRTARAEAIRFKNASTQRSTELSRLATIAERLRVKESLADTDPVEYARIVRTFAESRLAELQGVEAQRRAAQGASNSVAQLRADIEKCKEKRERYERAHSAVTKLIDTARSVSRAAAEQKGQIIDRVFSGTMNGLWRDLFERLVVSETFHPYLRSPEISRGRVETRLSAGLDGEISFQDLAAVLSSGNLNTAALSLFLTLNIVEQPRHHVLILDDPVQNMDDVHMVNLGALLKAIVNQAKRQLIVAVHDRALFDYLRIELGPTNAGESLITVEMERNDTTKSTTLTPTRYIWQPDKVVFGTASTA
jgi:exonuclease SbcC